MSRLINEYVDLDRYPIDRSGPERDAVIRTARAAIESDGCAVLKGFVRPGRLGELVAECDRVASRGHHNRSRTNPYFTLDQPNLPVSHPLRRFYDRSNAFVPADNFGPDSILRTIYGWPAFAPTPGSKRYSTVTPRSSGRCPSNRATCRSSRAGTRCIA